MAEIVWPSSLPSRPTRTDYADILPGNSLNFEMDTGPSKSWRVSSSSPGFRELAYILREVFTDPLTGLEVNQKAVFKEFWMNVDTNRWFWLPDPENPEQEIYVRIKAGQEKQGPSIALHAFQVWKVTFTVEVAANVPARPK